MLQVTAAGMQPVDRRRILVVDDDDIVRGLAREMLEEMGQEVIDVSSGRSALELLKEDTTAVCCWSTMRCR